MTATAPCFVFTPQVGASYASFRERVRSAENAGFDGFLVVDHMWGRGAPDVPCLEGWSLLAALAEATTRIRLGVLVTCNSYRNPGMLAKAAATVDHVSGGRVELGMGAGWMDEEYRAYGFEFPDVPTRLAQLGEALEVVTGLFTRHRTTVEGRHYRFTEAPFEPKPLQRPLPITIGGAGPKVLMRLVARYAQRWNCPMPAAGRLEEHLTALARQTGGWVGWRALTLRGLAEELALGATAGKLRTAGDVELTTLVDRALEELLAQGSLPRGIRPLARRPGFRRAVTDAVLELRVAGLDATDARIQPIAQRPGQRDSLQLVVGQRDRDGGGRPASGDLRRAGRRLEERLGHVAPALDGAVAHAHDLGADGQGRERLGAGGERALVHQPQAGARGFR